MVYKEGWWSRRRCGGLEEGVVVNKEVWWARRRCGGLEGGMVV